MISGNRKEIGMIEVVTPAPQIAAAQLAFAANQAAMASMGPSSHLGGCLYGMHQILGSDASADVGVNLRLHRRDFEGENLERAYTRICDECDEAAGREGGNLTDTELNAIRQRLVDNFSAPLTNRVALLLNQMQGGRAGIPLARPRAAGKRHDRLTYPPYEPLIHPGFGAEVLLGLTERGVLDRNVVGEFVSVAKGQLDANMEALRQLRDFVFVPAEAATKTFRGRMGGGCMSLILGGAFFALDFPNFIPIALGALAPMIWGFSTFQALRARSSTRRYRLAFGLSGDISELWDLFDQSQTVRRSFGRSFPRVEPRSGKETTWYPS